MSVPPLATFLGRVLDFIAKFCYVQILVRHDGEDRSPVPLKEAEGADNEPLRESFILVDTTPIDDITDLLTGWPQSETEEFLSELQRNMSTAPNGMLTGDEASTRDIRVDAVATENPAYRESPADVGKGHLR